MADDQPRKYVTIDGLRGLLAISVFAHHFAVTVQWQRTGQWGLTPSHAWNAMGHGAVTLFFMITGFLFFDKISNASRQLDLPGFMKGRLLRIYPVYLLCLGLVALIAAAFPDVLTSPLAAVKSVLWWLLFVPSQLFGMSGAGLVVAYAPWSLRYEWCFYLALPLLAWAWRRVGFHPAFVLALCGVSLCAVQWPLSWEHGPLQLDTRFIAPFMLGGTALLLVRNHRLNLALRTPAGSAIALIAFVALCTRGEPYSLKSYLASFITFVPIAAGASLFGLLRLRAMLILGAASYDVYILHGLVLFIAFHIVSPTGLIALSAVGFVLCLIGTGIAVIAVSLVAHRLVEMPAMKVSLRLRSADPSERLAAP